MNLLGTQTWRPWQEITPTVAYLSKWSSVYRFCSDGGCWAALRNAALRINRRGGGRKMGRMGEGEWEIQLCKGYVMGIKGTV